MDGELNRTFYKVEKEQDSLVEICKGLIRIPSFPGREGDIAEFISRKLKQFGLDKVWVDKLGDVIGLIRGRKEASNIVFDGHMDVVPPGDRANWRFDPLGAEVSGGAVWGRGASDMKGSIASMLKAAEILTGTGMKPRSNIYLVFVVQEETQEGIGIQNAIEEEIPKPDLVILGEATRLNLAIGHKGRAEIEVKTRGKTSHGSMPELGENAVYKMTPIVSQIEKLNERLARHPFLGKSTIALTKICCEPGEGPIIPDICRITLDRRIILGESEQAILSEIREVAKPHGAETAIIEEDLTSYTGEKKRVRKYFQPWLLRPDSPLVEAARLTLESSLKKTIQKIAWTFSTDGAYTAGEASIPTIGFGAGDERLAHTPNDHVEIRELIEACKGYVALMTTEWVGHTKS